MVDDPHYIGQSSLQDTTASPAPSGDIRDPADMNPSERAETDKAKETGHKKGDFQREFEMDFNDRDDRLKGDRYAHDVAPEVCTDFL